MSGRRNDIAVREGAIAFACRYQTRNMRNISHKIRSYRVGDTPHLCIIPVSGICARPCDDHARLEESCQILHLRIVDETSSLAHAIWERFEIYAGGTDTTLSSLVSMREMPSRWQVESHDTIVWF